MDIPRQQACFLIFGRITYLFTQGLLWNGTCANQSATYSPLFPTPCTKAVELAQKTGDSTWLTALPIAEHGFVLHKGAFHDAICLRYRWRPPLLPSRCVCGRNFTAEHALSCQYDGGLPTIHHNQVRNIKAHLTSDVCHNVGLEPILQPITSERLHHSTANIEDGGRVDIKAPGFSENDRQCAFFDVRVRTHLSLSPTLHLLQKT